MIEGYNDKGVSVYVYVCVCVWVAAQRAFDFKHLLLTEEAGMAIRFPLSVPLYP